MSELSRGLAAARPDWTVIPDELERAWAWLERLDGTAVGADLLTPYPHYRHAAPVFSRAETLVGWFEPDTQGYARLLPIGQASGDGSTLALWRDDAGAIRPVLLTSDGSGHLLGDDAADLLVLLAVGYDEISGFSLGLEPEDPLPDAALAPLRGWVAAELDREVPTNWPEVDDDEFTGWLEAQLGGGAAADVAAAPLPDSGITFTGDAAALLALLGRPDGPEVAAEVERLTGATLKGKLRGSAPALRKVGMEADSDRAGVSTFFIRTTDRPFGPIIKTSGPAYPRPDALVDGLGPDTNLAAARALLGEPEHEGKGHLRYVVDGRLLHLSFEDGGLVMVTLMREEPSVR